MSQKVLIAGASRGIGLELAVQYAADGWDVIAACRDPDTARKWLPRNANLQKLDVTSASSVAALSYYMDDVPIDLLIVSAGAYGPDTQKFLAPSDENFDAVMRTNVLGPMRLIQAFAPSVAKVGGKVVVLSSKMGSVSLAEQTTGLLYRVSKSAVNMVAKMAANEYGPQGATVISLHPGWVRTSMGGPDADLSVTESVEQMRKVIASVDSSNNGQFFDYTGRALSW
ncbi:MAG TPA: SDR family NAD(P)-dependent oxidoreductase [Rhodocyclaceae bacterium]|nr:SDR family NAD(P)-dependent oxidoreductase [Rhodocyclaceae bacterium]